MWKCLLYLLEIVWLFRNCFIVYVIYLFLCFVERFFCIGICLRVWMKWSFWRLILIWRILFLNISSIRLLVWIMILMKLRRKKRKRRWCELVKLGLVKFIFYLKCCIGFKKDFSGNGVNNVNLYNYVLIVILKIIFVFYNLLFIILCFIYVVLRCVYV